MNAIKVILLVAFVIISILLILLVLIQNDEGGGMGGLFGGAGSAAFGSHSASVVNKTTFVFVALFFLTAFCIARLNRKPALKQSLEPTAVENSDSSVGSTEEALDILKLLPDVEKPVVPADVEMNAGE